MSVKADPQEYETFESISSKSRLFWTLTTCLEYNTRGLSQSEQYINISKFLGRR